MKPFRFIGKPSPGIQLFQNPLPYSIRVFSLLAKSLPAPEKFDKAMASFRQGAEPGEMHKINQHMERDPKKNGFERRDQKESHTAKWDQKFGGMKQIDGQKLFPMPDVKRVIKKTKHALDLKKPEPGEIKKIEKMVDVHQDGGKPKQYTPPNSQIPN